MKRDPNIAESSKRRTACGCKSGAICMALGLFLCVGQWFITHSEAPSFSGLWQRAVVCALAGGVLGKLAGMLWAKMGQKA
jgi:hypothetical protein